MLVIRLARTGAKKRPFYHLVAVDSRAARDSGKYIERLGYFNPVARGSEIRLHFNQERVADWISKGAQPSERVAALIKEAKSNASGGTSFVEKKQQKRTAQKANKAKATEAAQKAEAAEKAKAEAAQKAEVEATQKAEAEAAKAEAETAQKAEIEAPQAEPEVKAEPETTQKAEMEATQAEVETKTEEPETPPGSA